MYCTIEDNELFNIFELQLLEAKKYIILNY